MAEQTDLPQPAESPEAEAETKRLMVDTLAEQQALAALDELIAKVDSGSELAAAAAPRPATTTSLRPSRTRSPATCPRPKAGTWR